ncbi:CoA-binding protein [Roseomonas sp. AR75]|uniref:CoA-binding protein n=1 Tax=Roseomonas sp. AR75 TaxID=2562311 RepID=UPI0010C07624|nr:CoA-binding protein [Roseomonas sp. AR75]
MTVSRQPYGAGDLARLLAPRSVALVGASPTANSMGARSLANLARFSGRVFPVNGRYAAIAGLPCHASLDALPEVPDVVIVALAAPQVEAVVADCARRGVGGVVIYAAGYAETQTAEGRAAQARLAAIAQESGMRIVGPNCAGYAVLPAGLLAGFPEFPAPRPGPRGIGLVAQSGALGLALSQAAERGVALTHVLTCGNSCDVDVADWLAALAETGSCAAVALTWEGLEDEARLVAAARLAASRGLPVAACRLGLSEVGAAQALVHTGSVVTPPERFPALCAEAGFVPVTRIEALMETACFLAKAPARPQAGGVAIASGSGGTAILAADAAARHGVAVPPPTPTTVEALRAVLPAFAAPRNPCDATAQVTANPAMLRGVVEALLADPGIGALVCPWGKAYRSDNIAFLGEAARRHGKPVCLVWMSQWLEGPGTTEAEADPDLALFRSLDACFAALAAWFARDQAMPRVSPDQ